MNQMQMFVGRSTQCGTAWYSMVRHGTVWYSVVQCGTVRYSTQRGAQPTTPRLPLAKRMTFQAYSPLTARARR
jgi:hypothetical protein